MSRKAQKIPIVVPSELFRWMYCLTAVQWKLVCYLALHTHLAGEPGEWLTDDELDYGKVRMVGKLQTRVDHGPGIDGRMLLAAIDGLWRDGILNIRKWPLDGTNLYSLNWDAIMSPDTYKGP